MRIYKSTSSFTRPNNTTAYSPGALVANATGLGTVVPLVFSMPVEGLLLSNVKISIADPSASNTANAQFNLHLFQFNPTILTTDGGTFSGNVNESGYLGYVYLDCAIGRNWSDNTTAQVIVDPNSLLLFTDTTPGNLNQVYGLLELASQTGLNYTPLANEVITVTLIGVD